MEKLNDVQSEIDERTKICSKCKVEKTRDDFYVHRRRGKEDLQGYCKACANSLRWRHGRIRNEAERQKVYASNKKSYQKNKAKYLFRAGQRSAQAKVKALEAHGSMACQNCGFRDHPAALEFHHRDPSQKRFNLANAFQSPSQFSWDEILAEIAKCDLICSNCHRIEHSSRGYDDLWERSK